MGTASVIGENVDWMWDCAAVPRRPRRDITGVELTQRGERWFTQMSPNRHIYTLRFPSATKNSSLDDDLSSLPYTVHELP